MWTKIYLSPEFPLIALFFIFFILIIGLKIIEIYSKKDIEGQTKELVVLLQKMNQNLFNQGAAMSTIADLFAKPISNSTNGNEKEYNTVLTDVIKTSALQAEGLVENISSLNLIRAAKMRQEQVDSMIQDVKGIVVNEKSELSTESQGQLAQALGGELQQSIGKMPQPVQQSQANASASATEIAFTEVPDLNHEEVCSILSGMKMVASSFISAGIPQNSEFNLYDVPKPLLNSLINVFVGRMKSSNKEPQEAQLLKFLLAVQATGTSWFVAEKRKSCILIQLFLYFLYLYAKINWITIL